MAEELRHVHEEEPETKEQVAEELVIELKKDFEEEMKSIDIRLKDLALILLGSILGFSGNSLLGLFDYFFPEFYGTAILVLLFFSISAAIMIIYSFYFYQGKKKKVAEMFENIQKIERKLKEEGETVEEMSKKIPDPEFSALKKVEEEVKFAKEKAIEAEAKKVKEEMKKTINKK
ncbi:MAG TPA: hypothetical protein VJK05_03205 [archaeon]|nr:hypothetical protein [archaeon]